MTTHQSIGMVELSSIAIGFSVTDAMLKAASVELVMARTICPGKYSIMVWGDVAAVEASVNTGINIGSGFLVNDLIIPNLHPQVFPALTATNKVRKPAAMGVLETFDAVSTIIAADASVKASDVDLLEIRLAMAIGGKAFYSITGDVAAVEAAVEAGKTVLEGKGAIVYYVVIPRPSEELFREYV